MASSRDGVVPFYAINNIWEAQWVLSNTNGLARRKSETRQPLNIEIMENKAILIEDG